MRHTDIRGLTRACNTAQSRKTTLMAHVSHHTRVAHALIAGLDTPEGADALRAAYALEKVRYGVTVEAFVRRCRPPASDLAARLN